MRLIVQCLVLLGVIFTLFMVAAYLSTWWAWMMVLLMIVLTWSLLCFLGRLIGGIIDALSWPQPGSFLTAKAVLQPVFDASFYNIQVHGQWPDHPVMFCVNYPNEPLEYLYFSLVADHCRLSVVSKDRTERAEYISKFMDGIFDDSINHITVSRQGGSFDHIRQQIQRHVLLKGRSVYFYPSGGYAAYQFESFRTGIFRIAAEYQIPIVPLVISHLNSIRDRTVHICIGPELVSQSHDSLVIHGEEFFKSRFEMLKANRIDAL